MRSNDKNERVARIVARGVMLTALLAMTLVGAAIKSVQARAAQSSTPAAPSAQAPAKGAQEGIGVHGHWTIDVKNPNGTLARHVEFENGLCVSSASVQNASGGDTIIAELLAGITTIGGWEIVLGSPTIPTGAAASGPACPLQAIYTLEQNNDGNVVGVNGGPSLCALTANCFPNLNPPTLNSISLLNVVTLAGQFTVPGPTTNSVTISAVGTVVNNCGGGGSISAEACVKTISNVQQFTGAYLTGVAPMPAAITVVGGQSVSVNVQLSFH